MFRIFCHVLQGEKLNDKYPHFWWNIRHRLVTVLVLKTKTLLCFKKHVWLRCSLQTNFRKQSNIRGKQWTSFWIFPRKLVWEHLKTLRKLLTSVPNAIYHGSYENAPSLSSCPNQVINKGEVAPVNFTLYSFTLLVIFLYLFFNIYSSFSII